METDDIAQTRHNIGTLKNYWYQRNRKFEDWYELLRLVDVLASKGMETYVSNEPQTFYNMAHYLLTRGKISHLTSMQNESALELEKRARVHRGCEYMWHLVDEKRKLGGEAAFIDELGFFLLLLGWYSVVESFDSNTGHLQAQVWSPYDTYPEYASGQLVSCVHSYRISQREAQLKASSKGWNYTSVATPSGEVVLDDYFVLGQDGWYEIILLDGRDVTGWQARPEMQLLVSPVGGFPDKGSLVRTGQVSVPENSKVIPYRGMTDWKRLIGRGIFEVNMAVSEHFNKWKSMITQILRDTAQPVTQEFSASPQASPEQLRERGALFHYAPGEGGLSRVPPPAIPIEIQANLMELRREQQKGSFNDAVFGMIEGQQAGYALSLLASSSANQILYPYMDGKHFVISQSDKFWLSNLKKSKRVFQVKGKFIEKISPPDVPEDVMIQVNSFVATPRDLMEEGTIANMLDKHYDHASILDKVYKEEDPQAIIRRKELDDMLNHPMSRDLKLISAWEAHARYLELRGDVKGAARFRRAASALEAQIGAPPPGQGLPVEASRIQAEREAGTPGERVRVSPGVASPEALRGFTPAELRQTIGKGTVRRT